MTIVRSGDNTMQRVVSALEASGYEGNEFRTCKFVGVNERGMEVHSTTYLDNETGEEDCALVYVWREDSKLKADF